jgi:hypothetical protein
VPPVAKDIHFVIAVEKEMRTMLEAVRAHTHATA